MIALLRIHFESPNKTIKNTKKLRYTLLCGKGGNIANDIDMLIAGIAIYDLTLVTNNKSQFKRVPGLRVGNWSKHLL